MDPVRAPFTLQVLQSLYKLVGSLDLLGNPAAIFSDVSGGVTQFLYQPRVGLVKSPAAFAQGLAAGSAGLAGGVIGGTSAGLLGVFSAVARGAENVTSALAFDPDYARRRQVPSASTLAALCAWVAAAPCASSIIQPVLAIQCCSCCS